MRFFRTDLKRVLTEPAFYFSIALGLILLIGSLIYQLIINSDSSRLFINSQSFALPFVAPLLSAIPYSTIIMQERETLYSNLMILKIRQSSYLFRRFIICGISGAMALVIPSLLLFLITLIINGTSSSINTFLGLLLAIPFGFGYAVISYGLTFVNCQRYLPMVMPQIIYLLCIYSFPYLKLNQYYPPLDISPWIYSNDINATRLIIPTMLTIFGFILTCYGKKIESEVSRL